MTRNIEQPPRPVTAGVPVQSGGKLAGGTCSASGLFSKDTVDAAWSVPCAPGHADADAIDACRTLIEHCQDGRRKTAEAMLEILKGQRR